MKKIIYLLAVLCIGCTQMDEELIPTATDQNDTPKTRGSKGDGDLDVLGYGYDMTKGYFEDTYARIQVINVEAIRKAYPPSTLTGVVQHKPLLTTYSKVIGETSEDYTSKMSMSVGLSKTAGVFSGNISLKYGTTESYSSKFSYASYYGYYRYKQNKITLTPNEMLPYLTIQFTNDLKSLSADEIVKRYGTHVLTDIYLGARVSIMYRAESTSFNKTSSISASLNATVGLFKSENTFAYDRTEAQKNQNYQIHYTAIGGDPKKVAEGEISTDPTQLKPIDNSAWKNSIETSTWRFIDAEANGLIPIETFVTDPVKKQAISEAVKRYIAGTSIQYTVPLYDFSSSKYTDHALSTMNPTTFTNTWSGWVYNGFLCNVFDKQYENTVPLYEFYQPGTKDHYYTTDLIGFMNKWGPSGWKYNSLVCYVYSKQVPNSIPIYMFTNNKTTDHAQTTNKEQFQALYGREGWIYENIICYVPIGN